LAEEIHRDIKRSHGAVSLARNEIHDQVTEMMDKEPRGKDLDVPTGTGVLAARRREMGFEVSCCDINPSYFSISDLALQIGELNQSLPYPSASFDFILCIEGLEHLENPFNAIHEFSQLLKLKGKVYHLVDTLSPRLIMGGNTLILVAEKEGSKNDRR
jgi:2-polyprenyl-3-methyl-5-hydroxy-6-metoxy-1,4-benzoquinol methylase